MNWLGFLAFVLFALFSIWNGKDRYSKKEWLICGGRLLLVLIATVLISFFFKWLALSLNIMPVSEAKHFSLIIGMSLLCVWAVKLLVVLIFTLFSNILGFHEKYNSENYQKLHILKGNVGLTLSLVAKVLVSFGSFMMFYGLWLA
jgi:hypothetical protein